MNFIDVELNTVKNLAKVIEKGIKLYVLQQFENGSHYLFCAEIVWNQIFGSLDVDQKPTINNTIPIDNRLTPKIIRLFKNMRWIFQ